MAQRYLYNEEVLGGPQENQKVTEGVLRSVEVVDSLDVEALGSVEVLEDFPVRARRPTFVISTMGET